MIYEYEIKKLNDFLEIIKNSKNTDFFLEIANFIDYINSKELFQSLIKKINIQEERDSKNYINISNKIISFIEKDIESLKKLHDPNNSVFKYTITSENKVSSLIYRYQDIIDQFKIKISDDYKKLYGEYDKTKKLYEYDSRIKIWNSYKKLQCLSELIKLFPNDINDCFARLGLFLFKKEYEDIIEGKAELKKEQRDEYTNYSLKIIHYITENLDKDYIIIDLLKKLKSKFEWYYKDEILKGKISENNLTLKVCDYLFDKGLFPIYKSLFGKVEPDTIDLSTKEHLVMEIKIIKSNSPKNQLLKGYNEILTYISTLNETIGYYLIFNINQNIFLSLPEKIILGDKIINIIIIDFHKQPSKSSRKIFRLIEKDFMIKSGRA